MESDADDGAPPAVARAEAEGELERLLADSRFHLSERNRAFLRYLAEARFSGQSKGVKAYSVAIDVFGRPSNFDPNTDPIVRIEATRLRTSLEQYYEAFGHETAVRIEVPRGSYIAQFHRTVRSEPAIADQEYNVPQEPVTVTPVAKSNNSTLQSLALIVGAIVVVVAGLVLALQASFESSDTRTDSVGKPVVTLLRSNTADTTQGIAALEENLMVALSRFENLRVRSETDLGPSRAIRRHRNGDDTLESQYEIVLRYRLENNVYSLRWRVIDTQSGEALATGTETADAGSTTDVGATAVLADRVAVQLASDSGVLGSLEMRKGHPATATGNICVLRGERALNRMDLAGLLAVRDCLDATIAADAENSDALATLARVLVAQDELAGRAENTDQALSYANRAMAAAPTSPRSLMARMVTMYANGQADAARSAGHASIALNPLDVENTAAFALRLYLNGEQQEGLGLLHTLPSTNLHSWDEDFLRALDDFVNHRHADTIAQLDGMVHEDDFASGLRIASLLCMGQIDKAKRALSTVQSRRADFLQTIANVLTVRRVDAVLRARVMEELAAAKAW